MKALSKIDWLNRSSVTILMKIIDNGDDFSRFVGGCVRNTLLNHPVADIDIATRHRPEKIIQLLSDSNVMVRPTGIKHGTVTAFLDNETFEITSLRRDLKTDGRRAKVSFTDCWKEDAARRDFTMNALFMDIRGNIYDPMGGYNDVLDGRVRFVGDASRRIKEDFLRILRFFRFYAYYGQKQIDEKGLLACKKFSGELWRLSGERVRSELFKIIISNNASLVTRKMAENKILTGIIPGKVRLLEFNRLIGLERTSPDPIRRLSVLLNSPTHEIIRRLKLSNKMAKQLIYYSETIIEMLDNPESIKVFLYKMRKMRPLDLLIVKTALNPDYNEMCKMVRCLGATWEIPKFPVRGADVLKLGAEAGAEVGQMLMETEQWWINGGFKNDKKDCLNWIQNHHQMKVKRNEKSRNSSSSVN